MLPETEVDDNNKYTHKDTYTKTHTRKGSGRGHARLPDQSTSIHVWKLGNATGKITYFFVH